MLRAWLQDTITWMSTPLGGVLAIMAFIGTLHVWNKFDYPPRECQVIALPNKSYLSEDMLQMHPLYIVPEYARPEIPPEYSRPSD